MASRASFTVPGDIPERTSWQYVGRLVDYLNQPIPRAALTTLTLTIYVQTTGNPTINGVDNISILNTGRGEVGLTDGSLRITFHAADTVIFNDGAASEQHVALLQCTYNAGVDGFSRQIIHKVTNLTRVT